MEIGRGGRLAALLLACVPQGAWAACPLLPGEHKLDFRLVQDGRAVELRRHGVPDSDPPLCLVELACRVPYEPRTVGYTLRADSILLGDIATMHFSFADGTTRSCSVVPR